MTQIEVQVVPHSDNFIVAIKTRGRYAPIASCGSAGHADIVQAALTQLAEQRGEMLLAALDALPRTAVPGGEEEVRVTRGRGEPSWTVISGKTVSSASSLQLAAETVLEQVMLLAGRAVVVCRDDNGLMAGINRLTTTEEQQ